MAGFDSIAAGKAEAAARLASNQISPSEAALKNPNRGLTVNLIGGGTQRMTLGVGYFYNQLAATPQMKNLNNPKLTMELAQVYNDAAMNGSWPSPYQLAIIAMRNGVPESAITSNLLKGPGGGGGGGGPSRAQQIKSLSSAINDLAGQYGIPFSTEQISTLAAIAQKENWSSAQIVDELTKNVDWFKLNSGTLKTSYEEFKTIGRQFLVNLSDASAQDWALRVAKGELSEETVMQNIKEAAKIANPWLASYIDQGLNPGDVLSGNRDFIAKNLEVDPLQLDLMDQKTLNLLTTVDANGQRKLADQTQMVANVRNDDRWKNTNNAKELASGMASMLAQIFGRSAF